MDIFKEIPEMDKIIKVVPLKEDPLSKIDFDEEYNLSEARQAAFDKLKDRWLENARLVKTREMKKRREPTTEDVANYFCDD